MENKSETLKKKLDKPNWKQWLPVYGIYQNIKDALNDKPNMILTTDGGIQPTRPAVFLGSSAYQAVSVVGTAYGLYQLAEKLF